MQILWPYVLGITMAAVARFPTLTNNVIFIDEPSYLVQARRLGSLDAFIYAFQYRSETKFQLGLLPHMLALALDPTNGILLVRIFGAIAVAASVCLLVYLSREAFATPVPGLISSSVWLLFLGGSDATLAPLLEYFQTPLVLLGIAILMAGIRNAYQGRPSSTYMAVVGLLVGLAALVKPPAVLLAPVFAVAALLFLGRVPGTKTAWKNALWVINGAAAPLILAVLPYLFRPAALSELLFNIFGVAGIYSRQGGGMLTAAAQMMHLLPRVDTALLVLGLAALGVRLFIYMRMSGQRADIEDSLHREDVSRIERCFPSPAWDLAWGLLFMFAGIALFAGYTTGEAKPHYLIPAVPLLMLPVGREISITYARTRYLGLRVAAAGALAAVVLVSNMVSVVDYRALLADGGEIYRNQMPQVDVPAVVTYIKAHTSPDDSIWVYYNAPEVYWLSGRKPATNEPVGTWLVDNYGPLWLQRTRTELERDKPTLIIGIAPDKARFHRTGIADLRHLPVVGSLLERDYVCREEVLANVTACALKSIPVSGERK